MGPRDTLLILSNWSSWCDGPPKSTESKGVIHAQAREENPGTSLGGGSLSLSLITDSGFVATCAVLRCKASGMTLGSALGHL